MKSNINILLHMVVFILSKSFFGKGVKRCQYLFLFISSKQPWIVYSDTIGKRAEVGYGRLFHRGLYI